jgi:O-antigen ligase
VNQQQHQSILALCQRAKHIGVYSFILLLPISIAFMQFGLGLLFLAYAVEAVLTKKLPRLATPINRPLLAYLAITLITTLIAADLVTGLDALQRIPLKLAPFYLVFVYLEDTTRIKKLTAVLVLAATLAASYGVVQHYLEVDLFRMTKPVTFLKHVNNDLKAPVRVPGFSSYMTFSGQLAMAIPLIAALFLTIKSALKKGFLGIAMLLNCSALLWTYTRSSWIALICALSVFGYIRFKRFSVMILLLLGAFLFFSIQPDTLDRTLSMFRAQENLERLYTWESTLRIIKDHPLTGIGKGNYSKLIGRYREERYPNFEFTSSAHAHNNILQAAVDGGIFSLLAYLWLWWAMFRESARTYQHIPETDVALKTIALGLFCALIAFFVQGFFEHNFGDSETVMTMWVIAALSFKLRTLLMIE